MSNQTAQQQADSIAKALEKSQAENKMLREILDQERTETIKNAKLTTLQMRTMFHLQIMTGVCGIIIGAAVTQLIMSKTGVDVASE